MKTEKPQLTISLLASNRLDTLPRCLDSLKPIMEAIPCELILVDTSKNPKVHELLLQYTDQVYEFEWCNDFAKARNEGLRRATGEWFMYLDDDEWFVDSEDLVEFFKSGEYKKYGFANYQIRNFLDETYTCYSDSVASRLIKLEEDTHFESKIHEYFTPIRIGRKNLNSMVYHSGYVYETEEKKQAHYERNCSLLLDMIKEEPTVIRWRLQLAQEYVNSCKWSEAEVCCKECIEAAGGMESDYITINIGTFYTALVVALQRQNKFEESVDVCKKALEDKRAKGILPAMMHLKIGESLLYLERFNESINHIEEYLSLRESIDCDDSIVTEQIGALVVGDALDEKNKMVAYCVLICSSLAVGNADVLRKYYREIGWDQQFICSIVDIEKYMVNAMWSMEYQPIFATVMQDVLRNKDLRVHFRKEILKQEREGKNDFQNVLYMLMKTMQAIVEGPQADNMMSYYAALKNYVQVSCFWCEFLELQKEVECQVTEATNYISAAMDVSDYIDLESIDTITALNKLKEAVEAVPEFAEGVGQYIRLYDELEKERETQRKRELEKLRTQVIEQVKSLQAMRQFDVAQQILEQLKQMFPDDAELDELSKVI